MSIILYSQYRRQGFRFLKSWQLAAMDRFSVRMAVVLLASLSVLALCGMIDEAVEQAEYRGKAAKEEYRLAEIKRATESENVANVQLVTALNQGSLLDTDTGDVLFFQVSKQKGL